MTEKLVNRSNYSLVMEYLEYLKGKRKDPKSIRRYWFLLKHLLLFAMGTPFERIHKIKPGLSTYVADLALSEESRKAITNHARCFLRWCKNYHEDEFTALPRVWIEDLTPVTVTARSAVQPVTEDEILQIAQLKIDDSDLALQRDRAAACLLYLSGIRGGSLVSLPINGILLDVEHPHVLEYPELGVQTKNKRRTKTYLYHIPELLRIVRRWDTIVRSSCHETSPWYMPVLQEWGVQVLDEAQVPGKDRVVALNHRFRILWSMLSLPHKSPHKFRHGSALYGLRRCKVMEEYHFVSRNLMHQDITMTDQMYINFEDQERSEAIRRISHNSPDSTDKSHRRKKRMDTGQSQPGLGHLLYEAHSTDLEHAIELLAEKMVFLIDQKSKQPKQRTS